MKRKPPLRIRLERIYDKLYARAEHTLNQYNPCQITIKGKTVTCNGCINKFTLGNINTLCCTGCKFHSYSTGCTATKPLTCKTWLCHSSVMAHHLGTQKALLNNELHLIRKWVKRLGFYVPRDDKDESIKQSIRLLRQVWRHKKVRSLA